jgi:hypothetical protein
MTPYHIPSPVKAISALKWNLISAEAPVPVIAGKMFLWGDCCYLVSTKGSLYFFSRGNTEYPSVEGARVLGVITDAQAEEHETLINAGTQELQRAIDLAHCYHRLAVQCQEEPPARVKREIRQLLSTAKKHGHRPVLAHDVEIVKWALRQ